MNRCVTCDYTEEHGSQLLNTPPSSNKVSYRRGNLNEYLCDDCFKVVQQNYRSLKTLASESPNT